MERPLSKILLWLALVTAATVESQLDSTSSTEVAMASNTTTAFDCPVNWKHHHGVAYCDNDNKTVHIQPCYCMTFDHKEQVRVGTCLLTCPYHRTYSIPWNNDTKEFNARMCSGEPLQMEFNRRNDSLLCSHCEKGYGFAAYSFQYISCVPCDGFSIQAFFKYIGITCVPLTLFFFFVIIFRFSVTSGSLNAYIFLCQLITLPNHMRLMMEIHFTLPSKVILLYFSLLGVWNLDFFRAYYKPFCLLTRTVPAPTIALDYLVAIYPLLLVLLTYLLVVLHDRNYRIVTIPWKLVYRYIKSVRKEWNLRSSLIDAFATFFLLSYVKILSVSFDLLMFAFIYNENGSVIKSYMLYINPHQPYGHVHLVYTILAVVLLGIFIVFPVALLCLYPCRCFQKCLNCCGWSSLSLHAFMDVFTGCYRHAPRDCRYFAGFYLLMRIMVLLIFQLTLTVYYFSALSVFLVLVAIVFAIARPYKDPKYNIIDVVILLMAALFLITADSVNTARQAATQSLGVAHFLSGITGLLLFVYPTVLALQWIWKLLKVVMIHKASTSGSKAAENPVEDESREREALLPHV